jgi:hypothetical protein
VKVDFSDIYRHLKEIEEALIESIEDGVKELSLIGTMRDKTFGKIANVLYQNNTVEHIYYNVMTIMGGFGDGYEDFLSVLETTNISSIQWLNLNTPRSVLDLGYILRVKSLRVLILENLDINVVLKQM